MADAGAVGRTATARRQPNQTPSAVPHVHGHRPGAAKSLLPRRSAFGYASLWLAQLGVVTGAERLCRAHSAADVVAAVNFARDHKLRVVIKGGGHSYQGTSNAADSLLIWTRPTRRS